MNKTSYTSAARQVLQKMPRKIAKEIMVKIAAYKAKPDSASNNSHALRGRDGISLRVGEWRVILQDNQVLAILKSQVRSEPTKVWKPSWT